ADSGKEAVDGLKAQVFDNRDFGYWKITVERPLRKSAQFTAERIAALRFDKRLSEEMQWMFEQWGEQVYEAGFLKGKEQKDSLDDWLEEEEIDRKAADKKKLLNTKFWKDRLELLQAAQTLHAEMGEALSNDFNQFQKQVKKATKRLDLRLSASQVKQILDAVSWRDPEAVPVLNKMSVFDYGEFCEGGSFVESAAARYGHFPVKGGYWSYEPDSELRDTENVPLNYPGGIDAYFEKEVHPHVEDAWIDASKTVVGYEISFNKYFYVHQPLRDLDEVVQEIRDLEAETEGLLEQILNFSNK
ncbi:MAG: hypothetical protein KJT03_17555, partial [Verrucomicrobiae bacterium]|nr:hypothetical protein [Verrucomicrobiae bacterium]